jgi:tetratricopeptide (TPR) repeat protein/tRNA A-37 threonylcarbamoyl transferase component Bud32
MPPDWDRVQSVFLSLADLPPGEQAVLLDKECGGDDELRTEVESLLASDSESAHGMSAVIANEAALWVNVPNLAGSRLGSWRIVREIGRGGMGTVYLAVRGDDQFQKQVAIKVVRHGMDTADVLERFRHERQILANLDHPYIARLLDGGTTADGRPFFVMDYVEGQPLDLFCKETTLSIQARCRLFLRVLEAVAHAHRNLVVHRDLKPANIFVKSDGSPKLLDFGVAKLLAADPGAGVTHTVLDCPFTPQYASPEQVHGFPVTTAVDIYSLGAVFYEMFTGQAAQRIDSLSLSEIERVVCHTEVTRPSVVAPGLDADLDNIVLMAMRKEPARRYQSADQFADDIHRYLSGRAVMARQDSFWYRTRKFARRNRFQISGVALIFVSLVTALVVTLAQARVAQSARREAEAQRGVSDRERARAEAGFRQAEAARAQAESASTQAEAARADEAQQRHNAEGRLTQLLDIADKTLFDIHDAVARLPGATEARKTLVKTTLDYLEQIRNQNGLDDRLQLSLAAGYSRIAAIQGDDLHASLGDFAGARETYLKAEALMTPLYARRGNDPAVILRWLDIERGLAENSRRHLQRDDGIRMYLALIPVAHRLAVLQPSDRHAVKQEADVEAALASSLQATDAGLSLVHANRQIEIVSGLVDRFPDDRDLEQELGVALASAAVAMDDLADSEKTVDYFERSIRIREQFLEREPHNAVVRRNLMVAYGNYATRLGVPWSANLGRYAEARTYARKSVTLARALVADDPQDKTARYDLGEFLARLGEIPPEPDQVADSLQILEEAQSILEPIGRDDPTSWGVMVQLTLAREYAAFRLQSLGRLEHSAETFRKSLAGVEPTMRADPNQPEGAIVSMIAEEGLAEIYALQGNGVAATLSAHHAVDRAKKFLAPRPDAVFRQGYLGDAYFELAWVERTLDDWDRAAADAERATSIWRSISHKGVLAVHRQSRERTEALVREIAAHRAQ